MVLILVLDGVTVKTANIQYGRVTTMAGASASASASISQLN